MPKVMLNPGYLANAFSRAFEVGFNAAMKKQQMELAKQRENRMSQAQEFEQNISKERLSLEKQKMKVMEETEKFRRKLLDLQAKAQELKNKSFQDRLTKLPEIAKNMQDILMTQLEFDKDSAEDIAALMAIDPDLALKATESIIRSKLALEQTTQEKWVPTRTVITTNPQTKTAYATILMASDKGNTKAIVKNLGQPLPSVYMQMVEESTRSNGSKLIRQPYTIYVKDPIATRAVTLLPDQGGKIPVLIVDENKNFELRTLDPNEVDQMQPETNPDVIKQFEQDNDIPVMIGIDQDNDMIGGQIYGIQP